MSQCETTRHCETTQVLDYGTGASLLGYTERG